MAHVRHQLDQTTLIELADILRRVCTRSSDGKATYAPDWSDERIATESSGRFVLANVRGLRNRLIGPLRTSGEDVRSEEVLRRLAELERWASARPREPFRAGVGANGSVTNGAVTKK